MGLVMMNFRNEADDIGYSIGTEMMSGSRWAELNKTKNPLPLFTHRQTVSIVHVCFEGIKNARYYLQ